MDPDAASRPAVFVARGGPECAVDGARGAEGGGGQGVCLLCRRSHSTWAACHATRTGWPGLGGAALVAPGRAVGVFLLVLALSRLRLCAAGGLLLDLDRGRGQLLRAHKGAGLVRVAAVDARNGLTGLPP